MSLASSNQPRALLEPTQLRRVHTITDRFSMANTYLIAEERCVVVDPGSELNIHKLQDYLRRFLRRAIKDIDLIVLTHLHFGYTTGIEILRRLCKAPVAFQSSACSTDHFHLFLPDYKRQMKLIDLWLNDVEGLPNHPDWRVIACPGYTPEHLCLYNPFTWELLCGDTITIQEGTPLVRRGTNPIQIEEMLRVLYSLQVHYLYPTHGRTILGLYPLKGLAVD